MPTATLGGPLREYPRFFSAKMLTALPFGANARIDRVQFVERDLLEEQFAQRQKLRCDQTAGGLWVAADCLALVADRLGDKRGKAEEIPIVPEFSEFLKSRQRDRGMVFEPIGIRGRPIRSKEEVGRRITEIALRACVKATSHDLRRGFATFWARHVMPAVLQRLMRHADIKTTMKFYVDIDVRSLTAELSQGATLGATAPNRENTLRS